MQQGNELLDFLIQTAYEKLFILYGSNIQSSTINQIKDFSEEQKRRWIWELTQNACDSVANINQYHPIIQENIPEKVDITIHVYNDHISFSHNGAPFKYDQFYGMMLRFSDGKKENVKIDKQYQKLIPKYRIFTFRK